ncbi:hypothetical protein BWI96_03355 [Siphonobacter sp. SORGH_AS_0500]|uniref:DUF3078 domain-containing protein n=1 Tax=Siphonobacter sp. SORGH_AS_0500 TaxID=1864824 RepID=UPI000CB4CF02|nr:DUF3078 domain-containing protein [Siphonobacter sp. SORGH_AS_0500]PKK38127.1 hypothetical protein BWI96_03355 [Siphonobacter sp. SORGH_AS_0500]
MVSKRLLLSILPFLFFSVVSFAQTTPSATPAIKDTTYWKTKKEFGLNFNQGSFSDNWQGGGVNNLGLGSFFNAKGEYRKDRDSWVNDFQSQFGFQKIKGQEFRKSIDRLFFDSKYGRKLGAKADTQWSFIGSLNVLTQFANGFDYNYRYSNQTSPLISGLFTPIYITEGIGFEWRPETFFTMSFYPGAVRHTILGNKNLYQAIDARNASELEAGNKPYEFLNYGIAKGKRALTEVAIMQLVANFDRDIAKNVNLKFRYQAFASFRDLAAIDNRIDAKLTAKINRYLNFNFDLIALYDQDQVMKIQYAQSMGLGFLYTFK